LPLGAADRPFRRPGEQLSGEQAQVRGCCDGYLHAGERAGTCVDEGPAPTLRVVAAAVAIATLVVTAVVRAWVGAVVTSVGGAPARGLRPLVAVIERARTAVAESIPRHIAAAAVAPVRIEVGAVDPTWWTASRAIGCLTTVRESGVRSEPDNGSAGQGQEAGLRGSPQQCAPIHRPSDLLCTALKCAHRD